MKYLILIFSFLFSFNLFPCEFLSAQIIANIEEAAYAADPAFYGGGRCEIVINEITGFFPSYNCILTPDEIEYAPILTDFSSEECEEIRLNKEVSGRVYKGKNANHIMLFSRIYMGI